MSEDYEILDLEKRWAEFDKNRKGKKGVLPIALIIASVVAGSGIFYFVNEEPKLEAKQEVAEKVESEPVKEEAKEEIKEAENEEPLLELKLQGMKISKNLVAPKAASKKPNIIKNPPQEVVLKKEPEPKNDEEYTARTDSEGLPKIFIKSGVKPSIEQLEAEFELKPDLASALELAAECLSLKQYAKARKYALRANTMDKDNEESWILYARASFALGKRNDAIKALESYLESSNSAKAKDLLDRIKGAR